jgi:tRNA U55 pseudouridine synthase TruB
LASGPFRLEQAHSLDVVRDALSAGRADDLLLPPDAGLDGYPQLTLTTAEVGFLARGQQLRRGGTDLSDGLVRVRDESGRLVAMARAADGLISPEKVFVPRAAE